jgi:hypothetical protein
MTFPKWGTENPETCIPIKVTIVLRSAAPRRTGECRRSCSARVTVNLAGSPEQEPLIHEDFLAPRPAPVHSRHVRDGCLSAEPESREFRAAIAGHEYAGSEADSIAIAIPLVL